MPRESDKIALLETEIIEKEEKCEEKCEDKILEFQEIMERLITQELHAKKEGEERWRTLDEAIRKQQMARREAAAASEKKNKKKNRIQR